MADIKVGSKVMFRGYEANGVYTVRSINGNGKVGSSSAVLEICLTG